MHHHGGDELCKFHALLTIINHKSLFLVSTDKPSILNFLQQQVVSFLLKFMSCLSTCFNIPYLLSKLIPISAQQLVRHDFSERVALKAFQKSFKYFNFVVLIHLHPYDPMLIDTYKQLVLACSMNSQYVIFLVQN